MNLFGGFGIASNSFIQNAWPSVFINVMWALIAAFALIEIQKQNKNT